MLKKKKRFYNLGRRLDIHEKETQRIIEDNRLWKFLWRNVENEMQNVQNALEENLSSGNMFGNCETDAKESE